MANSLLDCLNLSLLGKFEVLSSQRWAWNAYHGSEWETH
jgi:hypothetical protein